MRILGEMENEEDLSKSDLADVLRAARDKVREVMGPVEFSRSPFVRGAHKVRRSISKLQDADLIATDLLLPPEDDVPPELGKLPEEIRGIIELTLVESLSVDQVAGLLDSNIEDVISVISALVERLLSTGQAERPEGNMSAQIEFHTFDAVGRRLLFKQDGNLSVRVGKSVTESGEGAQDRVPKGISEAGDAPGSADANGQQIRFRSETVLDRLRFDSRAIPLGSGRPRAVNRSVGSWSSTARRRTGRSLVAHLAVLVIAAGLAAAPYRGEIEASDSVSRIIAAFESVTTYIRAQPEGNPLHTTTRPISSRRVIQAASNPRLLDLGQSDRATLRAHSEIEGSPRDLQLTSGSVAIRTQSGTVRILRAGVMQVLASNSEFEVERTGRDRWSLQVSQGRIDVNLHQRSLRVRAGQTLQAWSDGYRVL